MAPGTADPVLRRADHRRQRNQHGLRGEGRSFSPVRQLRRDECWAFGDRCPANPAAIATDIADGWVWYLTENDSGGWVGNVSSAGTTVGSVQDGGNDLGGLVVDPTVPDGPGTGQEPEATSEASTAASPPVLGDQVPPPAGRPTVAYGPGRTEICFITLPTENEDHGVHDRCSEGVFLDDFVAPGGRGPRHRSCSARTANIWFGAVDQQRRVHHDPGGDVAPVNDADGPGQLAIGPTTARSGSRRRRRTRWLAWTRAVPAIGSPCPPGDACGQPLSAAGTSGRPTTSACTDYRAVRASQRGAALGPADVPLGRLPRHRALRPHLQPLPARSRQATGRSPARGGREGARRGGCTPRHPARRVHGW